MNLHHLLCRKEHTQHFLVHKAHFHAYCDLQWITCCDGRISTLRLRLRPYRHVLSALTGQTTHGSSCSMKPFLTRKTSSSTGAMCWRLCEELTWAFLDFMGASSHDNIVYLSTGCLRSERLLQLEFSFVLSERGKFHHFTLCFLCAAL